MVDPKARSLLQEQISIIQRKMIDRVVETFLSYANSDIAERINQQEDAFDAVMELYEDYNDAIINDIIAHIEHPTTIIHSSEFTILVKRLNKGYAKFIKATTRDNFDKYLHEYIVKKELNPEESVVGGEENGM